jgi:hypothetical protein
MKTRVVVEVLTGVIVITTPRARDSDFTKETTTKEDLAVAAS